MEKKTDGYICPAAGSALQPTTTKSVTGEVEELRSRHFNLWSTLGINFSTIGTPLSIGTYLAFTIGVGGSPAYIYGYITTCLFQIMVCICLAELAATFPHSSGMSTKPSVIAWTRF